MQRKKEFRLRKAKRVIQKMQQRLDWVRRSAWTLLPIAGVLAVLLIGYVLLFSSLFAVKSITITRSDPRLNPDLIQRALTPLFGRHMLFLSSLEVPPLLTAALPKATHSAVPDVQNVTLHKRYPSQLQVSITLKPIIYRLRIEEPGAQIANQDLTASGSDFLTSDGTYVVYPVAAVQSGAQLPVLRIVDWGVRPEPWKVLLEPEVLTAINHAETSVRSEFTIPIRGRTVFLRAREFHLQTDKVALWFDLKSAVLDQLSRLKIYRQIAPGSAREYIDLRITDKVVYR